MKKYRVKSFRDSRGNLGWKVQARFWGIWWNYRDAFGDLMVFDTKRAAKFWLRSEVKKDKADAEIKQIYKENRKKPSGESYVYTEEDLL